MLTKTNKVDTIFPLVGSADLLCQNAPLVCEERLTVNPTNRRTRGFLLGENMETKICSKCKTEKPFSEFYRNLQTKYQLDSWCKECQRLRNNTPHRNKYNSDWKK